MNSSAIANTRNLFAVIPVFGFAFAMTDNEVR
jgi:hypothetical protein